MILVLLSLYLFRLNSLSFELNSKNFPLYYWKVWVVKMYAKTLPVAVKQNSLHLWRLAIL